MCAAKLRKFILFVTETDQIGYVLKELIKPSIQMPNLQITGTIWLGLRQHLPIELSLPGFSCSCSHDWKEDASNSEFCMIIKLIYCRLRSETNQSYQTLDADHQVLFGITQKALLSMFLPIHRPKFQLVKCGTPIFRFQVNEFVPLFRLLGFSPHNNLHNRKISLSPPTVLGRRQWVFDSVCH